MKRAKAGYRGPDFLVGPDAPRDTSCTSHGVATERIAKAMLADKASRRIRGVGQLAGEG